MPLVTIAIISLSWPSNGHSVAVLEDHELRAFHDIEFSLDYPTQAEQDAPRGPGNWALIHQQAERCLKLNIPVTEKSSHSDAFALRVRSAGNRNFWKQFIA
jgi:hypothetical protein